MESFKCLLIGALVKVEFAADATGRFVRRVAVTLAFGTISVVVVLAFFTRRLTLVVADIDTLIAIIALQISDLFDQSSNSEVVILLNLLREKSRRFTTVIGSEQPNHGMLNGLLPLLERQSRRFNVLVKEVFRMKSVERLRWWRGDRKFLPGVKLT